MTQINMTQMKVYEFVVILGATGGIGAGMARGLLNRTQTLYLLGRSLEKLRDLQQSLTEAISTETEIVVQSMDLEDDALSIQQTIASLELHKGIGIIVNCAGTYVSQAFSQSSPQEINRHFLINIISPMQIVAELIGTLERGSLIINIGSSLSCQPRANRVLTSSVKHAVRGFSLSLSEELAEQGVRVCLINPRSVATPLLLRNTSPEKYQQGMPVEDLVRAVIMIADSDPKTLFSELDVGALQGFLGR